MDGPLGEWVRKEIAAKGLYAPRKVWGSGMRQITTGTHPIRVADDLAGFRVRVLESKITIDFYKTSRSPTPMAMAETTPASDAPHRRLGASACDDRDRQDLRSPKVPLHDESQLERSVAADQRRLLEELAADIQAIVERNNDKYGALERTDIQNINASTRSGSWRRGWK